MLGLRLKEFRDYLNLSGEELGQVVGVQKSVIYRYEKSDIIPTKEVLDKIVSTYNINLHWLLTGTGSMFLTDQPEGECPNCAELQKVIDKLEANLELLKSIIKDACAHNHLAEKKNTG